MVNFIIVDDNRMHRKKVYDVIFSYMMNNNIDFKIHEFGNVDAKLSEFLKTTNKDCVYILDLELPGGDGIDVTREVRYQMNDWVSPIIVLTAHTSSYYKIYKQKLQILDFIGKCNDIDDDIKENIDISLRVLNQTGSYKFTYKNIGYNIPYSDIDYIQREDRRTKIVTRKETYYRNISINDIKKELPAYFVISLKGTLVNTKNIFKIDWNSCIVYFKDGNSGYLVSRNHKKEFGENDF